LSAAPRREIAARAFLAKLPLFAELGAAAIDRIAAGTSRHELARGQLLFRQGDRPTGMYMVVYGEIQLIASTPSRGPRLSGVIGAGRSFGEPVMFLDKPALVDAQASQDSLVLHVPKALVFAEIDGNPKFARRIIAGLSKRIEALVREIDTAALGSATERLIAYLLRGQRSEARGEVVITLAATKAAIASQLNLSPEHLSRVLHELTQRELLRVEGRRIVILDVARLAGYAKRLQRGR
jgi:CRP-like cAMP-binding protein